jgi:hypothetical protein
MVDLLIDIIRDSVPLLIAYLVYLLGLRAYHLQREYELVRRRYLDEGLDAFAADVEHALAVFRNNWQHCLIILRYFRDMDAAMPQELLSRGYIEIDQSQFRLRPNYRVGELLGDPDQVFWKVQQSLFAQVASATSTFKNDIGSAIRLTISEKVELTVPKDQMVNAFFEECESKNTELRRYHELLGAIQSITTEFEKRRFTLRSVHRFKYEKRIRAIVDQLKRQFADKFEKSTANGNEAASTTEAPKDE